MKTNKNKELPKDLNKLLTQLTELIITNKDPLEEFTVPSINHEVKQLIYKLSKTSKDEDVRSKCKTILIYI